MGKLLAAVAATALVAGPAAAFYFPGWPADGLPRPPNLYGPSGGYWPTEEISTQTLLHPRPPQLGRPPSPPVSAQTVPEPATLVLVMAGWVAVRVMRRGQGERPV